MNSNGNGKNGISIQTQWRRSKVLELSSQGYNQREIASTLHVTQPTVNKDLSHIRQEAQDSLQNHIHEVIPLEYRKCMIGMKNNLKETLVIAAASADPRIKLQARAIANDCYKFILDMSTNAGIVSDALKYVAQKKEELSTLLNNSDIEEGAKEIQITTNQVF